MQFIVALYQFNSFKNFKEEKPIIFNLCNALNIVGTLILAEEGINGTLTASKESLETLIAYLKTLGFNNLELKMMPLGDQTQPFLRLKVKIKKEIVTTGIFDINPLFEGGTYIESKDWNDFIKQEDVVVIDTRNDYEFNLGTFKNALNPKTDIFRNFEDFLKNMQNEHKNKKVAMFCTGGIRCEKATAIAHRLGYKNVYHLKGGILQYFIDITPKEQDFSGECYVFDRRMSVRQDLGKGQYTMCYGCRLPLGVEDRQGPHYEKGVSCLNCFSKTTLQQKSSFRERQKQVELAAKHNRNHIGYTQ